MPTFPTRRLVAGAAFLAAAWLAPAAALAQACDLRPPHVQYARDGLQRAATEGDLATALDYADRVRRQFEQLATTAGRCACPGAATRFEALARDMRQAQMLESRKELREFINRIRPSFDAALAAFQDCARR